jgi:hypothetical protein
MKLRCAAIALGLALWAAPAFAQGCAMCYTSASGATKDGQKAISRAVVVLLIPPIGFMTVGLGLAFRYGKQRDDAADSDSNQSREL